MLTEMKTIWGPKSVTNAIDDLSKKRSRKNIKVTAKGFRNGAQIDTNTHQKSMLKLLK